VEPKKVRHSRLSPGPTGRLKQQGHLPSPLTNKESTASDDFKDDFKEGTVTPPKDRTQDFKGGPSQKGVGGLSSPPSDTQPFSQFISQPKSRAYAVEDEEGEEVWGYLVPMDDESDNVLVLRRREACPVPTTLVGRTNGREKVPRGEYNDQEEEYEKEKQENGITAGGYLIGRHRECGKAHPFA
jgi:serine/threonine-protein kinase Chk2